MGGGVDVGRMERRPVLEGTLRGGGGSNMGSGINGRWKACSSGGPTRTTPHGLAIHLHGAQEQVAPRRQRRG